MTEKNPYYRSSITSVLSHPWLVPQNATDINAFKPIQT